MNKTDKISKNGVTSDEQLCSYIAVQQFKATIFHIICSCVPLIEYRYPSRWLTDQSPDVTT